MNNRLIILLVVILLAGCKIAGTKTPPARLTEETVSAEVSPPPKTCLTEMPPAGSLFIISRRVYDPNDRRTCRQWLAANPPDYSGHPLYGQIDVVLLKRTIEQTTGKPWIITFAKFWCDCHPPGDPIAALDVDWDGLTDMRDFAILAAQ